MIKLSDYDIVRVAAVTPKMVLGNPYRNVEYINEAIKELSDKGCKIACFPELSITGYTVGDLLYQDELLTDAEEVLESVRRQTETCGSLTIVGCPIRSKDRLYNCAVVIACGSYVGIVPKTYLCNTREFYEERYFATEEHRSSEHMIINGYSVPFGTDMIFTCQSNPHLRLGMEICEDLWAVIPPSSQQAIAGANILFNLSASNEDIGKFRYRHQLVVSQSGRCLSAYVYSSAGPWESSSDLVFSGHSLIAENGSLTGETERFSFETVYVMADIDLAALKNERLYSNSFTKSEVADFRDVAFDFVESPVERTILKHDTMPMVPGNKLSRDAVVEEILKLQSTGLMRRLAHLGDDTKLVLGVSGGLDSTLALIVGVYALTKLGRPASELIAVTMPGFGTGTRTKNNATVLMERFGVTCKTIPIGESVKAHLEDIGHDGVTQDITYENAQARERTQILMDLANMTGGIVLGTGDLSEIALGWSTYNGDHMSMYNVNAGVPKTLISHIIHHYAEIIDDKELAATLRDVVDTPITPELIPAAGKKLQETEDVLGPYILNDYFLFHFVRKAQPPRKIYMLACEAFEGIYSKERILDVLESFYKRFVASQFKRSAMPDGPKVGSVSLSPRGDWRMPSDADIEYWVKQIDELRQ
ncbi:MAG: NAD(+) synthase [Candidatus Kapaibacteriales bacterium]